MEIEKLSFKMLMGIYGKACSCVSISGEIEDAIFCSFKMKCGN